MNSIHAILIFVSLLFSGLVAGLLYSYSCSVNPGLKTLSDSEYIRAMQSINSAIQNPLFFTVFIGLLFLLPVTAYSIFKQQTAVSFYLFLIAAIVYVIGVFGITMFGNVPLNEQLTKFTISTATINEISAMRQSFEKSWSSYHTVRTIASLISFGLVIISIIKSKL
jgi:uncharacterized membrane protein